MTFRRVLRAKRLAKSVLCYGPTSCPKFLGLVK
jgi:hypothetical protein